MTLTPPEAPVGSPNPAGATAAPASATPAAPATSAGAATASPNPALAAVLAPVADALAWMKPAYEWFHQHPELSMEEEQTRAEIVRRLEAMNAFEITELGGGVTAVLRNGEGPTVLFRADFDGLPVTELTGLPYASTAKAINPEGLEVGTMHACGHDVHVTTLLGAAELMAKGREHWSGTFIALFQPGEEIGAGAKSMVAAGLTEAIPAPDFAFGQHVMGAPAGTFNVVPGPAMSGAQTGTITVYGAGGHGSMPNLAVDPVLLASQIVVRLQGIVSRELKPGTFGVITVGAVQAGNKANIIPDRATLMLSVRAYTDEVADTLKDAIERIVRAECAASGSPQEPDFDWLRGPVTTNDVPTAERVTAALAAHFGPEAILPPEASTGSEDFHHIPAAFGTPYTFWFLGGFADAESAPGNHSPYFAPVQDPTLQAGTEAVIATALEFLG
ncbi:amidohydrolase [Brevibacterium samyangense]|uniref:M20 family metallopeptidase n=1 Tax=Brevibacterium samyangense TaxID=366888 RepID=A0ABP5EJX0_9MICO